MKQTSTFQMILLGVFGLFMIIGIFFFATYRTSSIPDEEVIGTVAIWGTYDARAIGTWIDRLSSQNENLRDISYREFSPRDFNQEVLEALAENRAPDLLLLDNSQVHEQINRIDPLVSEFVSKNQFRQDYLEVGEAYFGPDGILGLPLFVDPMVMFWNRNLFSSAGEVKPPIVWQDFFRLVPLFTKTSENFTVQQTALPFGESVNVNHFKQIISTLILQVGNPITTLTPDGYRATLVGSATQPSAFPAFTFFTDFSNPSSESYSWNRSLPTSEEFFLAGKSAVYFGFASEVQPLQLKNPNLNFDIAEVPQSETATNKAVYADLYGLFIPRAAQNKTSSYRALSALTSSSAVEELQSIVKLATVRRDLAGQTASDDLFTEVFRKESIYAKSFIDPDQVRTNNIFSTMIESITSGQKSIDDALRLGSEEINVLFAN